MQFPEEGPFIRVYRLPEKLTNGYCFGGGVPITFTNVDWFGTTKPMTRDDLIGFVSKKAYAKQPGRLLVMSDVASPEFTFILRVPHDQ